MVQHEDKAYNQERVLRAKMTVKEYPLAKKYGKIRTQVSITSIETGSLTESVNFEFFFIFHT